MRPFRTCCLSAALAMACAGAPAQGWPSSDCPALLASGHPRPAWGSKEKVTQDGLLLMINYQMAIAACQNDEIIKTLRQNASKPEAAKPKAEPPKPAKPDEAFPRLDGNAAEAGSPAPAAPASAAKP